MTNAWRHLRLVLVACVAVAILLAAGQTVSAQCAMCRSAIAGAPDAAKLSSRLNIAVLVLLIPPVLIFCGIFYAAFRQLKSRDQESEAVSEGARIKTKSQLFASLRLGVRKLVSRKDAKALRG